MAKFALVPRVLMGLFWRAGGERGQVFPLVLAQCPEWSSAPHPGWWWDVSAILKGLQWTPQYRLGVRVFRGLFISPVFACLYITQQQAERGEGDCPGSHSKIGSEQAQASCMFRGLPGRQVGGKEAQLSVPSLLLWPLENVLPHSNVGTELKAMAEGWES